jgi:hypothetical protein
MATAATQLESPCGHACDTPRSHCPRSAHCTGRTTLTFAQGRRQPERLARCHNGQKESARHPLAPPMRETAEPPLFQSRPRHVKGQNLTGPAKNTFPPRPLHRSKKGLATVQTGLLPTRGRRHCGNAKPPMDLCPKSNGRSYPTKIFQIVRVACQILRPTIEATDQISSLIQRRNKWGFGAFSLRNKRQQCPTYQLRFADVRLLTHLTQLLFKRGMDFDRQCIHGLNPSV